MTRQVLLFNRIPLASVLKLMLLGVVIGLVTISFFVFQVNEAPARWAPNWRLKPLLLTPLVSALGIQVFFLKDLLRPDKSWMNVLLLIFSALVYLVALWLGVVLGLDGTMWN
jgi:hypothetical protein